MDLPKSEALKRLRAGMMDFVYTADASRMAELKRISPEAPFFTALRLLAESDTESERLEQLLMASFDTSYTIRREVLRIMVPRLIEAERAQEAMKLMEKYGSDEGTEEQNIIELRGETLFALGKYRELFSFFGSLHENEKTDRLTALSFVGEVRRSLHTGTAENAVKEKILDYFLGNSLGNEAIWVYDQILELEGFNFDPWETEVLQGRIEIIRRSYGPGLWVLRRALERDRDRFFKYPELIGALGLAYQYGGYAAEGAEFFAGWLENSELKTLSREQLRIRYMLNFYAGRLFRQGGKYSQALNFFNLALPLTPDGVQYDACVWYLIDTSYIIDPLSAPKVIQKYAPLWHRGSNFTSLLDSVCGTLISSGEWNALVDLFRVIRSVCDDQTLARYAYIIGRAIDEGYIGTERPIDLLTKAGLRKLSDPTTRTDTSRIFYRMAYEADKASLYYRSLSAAILGETLEPDLSPSNNPVDSDPTSTKRDEFIFLMDFFNYGCADLALPYILRKSRNLNPGDIQALAKAFGEQGLWGASIRTADLINQREGYTSSTEDLTLLYPLPFREAAEELAETYMIPKELFFGLLRTESAFIPDIVSRSGAVGLAQLMPATAKDVAERLAWQGGPDFLEEGELDLTDPETNMHLGAWYLRHLMDRMGSPMLALASYNGGITRVRSWLNAHSTLPEDLFLETIPIMETREYGRKVLAAATVYGYLYFDLTMDAVVADIFPNRSRFE